MTATIWCPVIEAGANGETMLIEQGPMRVVARVKRYHDAVPGSTWAVERKPFWSLSRSDQDRCISGKTLGNFIGCFNEFDNPPTKDW